MPGGRNVAGSSTYHRKTALFFILSLCSVLFILTLMANAHEKWVLTPQQVAELNAQPRPYIFCHLTPVNLAMYAFTLFFVAGLVLLNHTKGRELFLGWQVWLASRGAYASLGLRIALFVLLGMAGLGLGPRSGTALFEAPTLGAPDLELRLAGPGWGWIAWVEVVLALCFILGIYVRPAAAVLMGLSLVGLHLFGWGMLDYIGLIGGAAVYLLLQGAGPYHVPMPRIWGTSRITAWLADQPRARAQWLLQILVGFNLAYLGIAYKFFQPKLMIAILQDNRVPTFGIAPPLFVLTMALVEGLSGLLIMAGVLTRFLSVMLFVSFIFFSAILGEGVFGHIIFYGLLVSFITNGEGRWSRPAISPLPRSARARSSVTPFAVAADTASRWNQQMELSRDRVDELAQRLEQQAAELRRELAKSQEILEKRTRKIELQIQARLNDAVAEATSQFEDAAARGVERHYERLLENSHIAMQEALSKLEVRSAEVQALMQSAVNSALEIFQRQTEMQANLALSETKERAAAALSSLEAETRPVSDAHRQSLETDGARRGALH